MPRLTNPTDGIKGAWLVDPDALFGGKSVWIEPNGFVDVKSITASERKSFEAVGGVVTNDPMDHDGDGKMGGSVVTAAEAPRRGRPPKAKD